MSALHFLAFLTLGILIFGVVELAIGKRKIFPLKNILPGGEFVEPTLSVVIPARNEEQKLKIALTSVLNQEYRNLEVIAVNDRSTDATGEILDKLAKTYPNLRVFHLSQLPSGWLGKNYALFFGAEQATGEFLLFSDADIVMNKTALKRAVFYLQNQNFDHLVVGPQIAKTNAITNAMLVIFVINFMLFLKPWKAKNPGSKRFVGGGAFSLMRRQVYQQIGSMQAIPMCVADDLKLGQLIKKHGFRQDFLGGADMIFLEWYSGAREMIDGLTKNSFAVLDFSVIKISGAIMYYLMLNLWPLLALFLTSGSLLFLNGFIVVLNTLLQIAAARYMQLPLRSALASPLAVILHIYILLRSTVMTISQGGISWRGTFYPIEEIHKYR